MTFTSAWITTYQAHCYFSNTYIYLISSKCILQLTILSTCIKLLPNAFCYKNLQTTSIILKIRALINYVNWHGPSCMQLIPFWQHAIIILMLIYQWPLTCNLTLQVIKHCLQYYYHADWLEIIKRFQTDHARMSIIK